MMEAAERPDLFAAIRVNGGRNTRTEGGRDGWTESVEAFRDLFFKAFIIYRDALCHGSTNPLINWPLFLAAIPVDQDALASSTCIQIVAAQS